VQREESRIVPVLNQFKSASQATEAALQQASSQKDGQVAATFHQLAAKWTSALTKLETLQPSPQFTVAYDLAAGRHVGAVTLTVGQESHGPQRRAAGSPRAASAIPTRPVDARR
jgi:hypothetical protein